MAPRDTHEYLSRRLMEPDPALVVFSEVDGILPDGSASALETAMAACDVLARNRIPLVLCSGRTRAQLERVQQALSIDYPFICEHGAAVFVPIGCFPDRVPAAREVAGFDAIEFGRPYSHTVESLRRTAQRLRIEVTGFNDMSVEEVAAACGLSLLEARLAKLREYSEPFRIAREDDRARDRLFKALRADGVGCIRGDPYHHVGAPAHRRAGLELIQELYERALRRPVLTVGFGSAVEHVPMLRQVHVPVLVCTGGPVVSPEALTAIRSGGRSGVAAWAQTIHAVAQRLVHRDVAPSVSGRSFSKVER